VVLVPCFEGWQRQALRNNSSHNTHSTLSIIHPPSGRTVKVETRSSLQNSLRHSPASALTIQKISQNTSVDSCPISAAVEPNSSVFWVIMRRQVVWNRRFGTIGPILNGQDTYEEAWPLNADR
jgi:hypothetical protein